MRLNMIAQNRKWNMYTAACFVFSCETGLLFIRFLITWVETYKLDTPVLVGSAN